MGRSFLAAAAFPGGWTRCKAGPQLEKLPHDFGRIPTVGKTNRTPTLESDGYAILDKDWSRVDPYPYVYVNADGSARELHPDERDYLETRFQPGDGARPYIKRSYSQRNGWGELAGFLKRSQLPGEIVIQPAPAENPSKPLTRSDQIQFLRDKGFVVTENPDGTFTAQKPKPGL